MEVLVRVLFDDAWIQKFYLVLVHEIKVKEADGIKKLVIIITLGS